jgi:hypothetical protein
VVSTSYVELPGAVPVVPVAGCRIRAAVTFTRLLIVTAAPREPHDDLMDPVERVRRPLCLYLNDVGFRRLVEAEQRCLSFHNFLGKERLQQRIEPL